jgi:cyclopropane-fatty-acyl-phospholipid synthase
MRISGTADHWHDLKQEHRPALPRAARKVAKLLGHAGIRLNGPAPWDIQVHDSRFYGRVLMAGSLGAGESYVDGWWDVDALDEFFARVEKANLAEKLGGLGALALAVKATVLNLQTRARAKKVAEKHYDLGNDLFEAMLGGSMQYSCAYWRGAETLDQAQENKLHLICRKLGLQPGMRLLDIGGGFGSLSRFAAKEYGCEVVAYNISREQVAYARELCRGLSVRIEEKDYRAAALEPEPFDRIVSVGFFEHVGYRNYRPFFELVRGLLKNSGLFLLHSIGGNQTRTVTDPWIDKYIFPNGMLPSMRQISEAIEGFWVMEDWHNFGPDYDRTLIAWWQNFENAWPQLRSRYDSRFYRMWRYYLLSCAGAFRARTLQLWQIILSKGDVPCYTPVR